MLTNVKLALAERRMRQADLALAIGVPPTTLSEYVNGRRDMPPHLKARIAETLQADPDWLFARVARIPALKPAEPVAASAAA
jgi:transcriptional regulator with XRE-family HTH domain